MTLDFLVPGLSRCGTTTLCALLASHPDIFIPQGKDFRFFDLPDYEEHWDPYTSRFADATTASVVGDASVWYTDTEYEQLSRQRILHHFPDIKLIFVVRDPIARVESAFRQLHHSGEAYGVQCPYDIGEALQAFPNLINDTLYWSRINNYRRHMSDDKLLIVFLEDLVAQPEIELSRCWAFLGVEPHVDIPDIARRLNTASPKRYDTHRLRQMRRDPQVGPALRTLPHDIQEQFLPKLGLREAFSGEPLDWQDATRNWLVAQIAEDIHTFLREYGKPSDYWPRFAHAWEQASRVRKRAFLVLGPESHGTHLVTQIFIQAGCHGHAGDHVQWQPESTVLSDGDLKPWEHALPTDLQPWDTALPTIEDPIVWRRSIPHGKEWIDIEDMVHRLQAIGYLVKAIVVTRDQHAALQSQLKWHHIQDIETGKRNIQKAYLHIFSQLQKSSIPYTVVNYEALIHYPQSQDVLLTDLGLALPAQRCVVYDGNKKWYADTLANELADFPESWFACEPDVQQAYHSRVQQGYQRMARHTAVFCGLARDVRDALPSMMARIERAGTLFQDYRVVIYENDSCDGTREVLQLWRRDNPKVEVLSDELNAPRWGGGRDAARMAQLAACRNRYLQHVAARYRECDYLIVLDMDLPKGFSYDGLANTFSYDGWHVVGSNGLLVPPFGKPDPLPMFYDAWAFRREGDVEAQAFDQINQLQFRRGEDLVPVWSCFGGLAVYDMQGMQTGVRYGGDDCEHVVLHRQLRERGFDRQFLNPSQIVLYAGQA